MNTRIRIITSACLLIAALLAACGTPTGELADSSQTREEIGTTEVADSSQTREETATGEVPDPLQTIEEAAEDIIDYAPHGTWDKVAADVAAIDSAWKAYQPRASGDGASQAMQDALAGSLARLQTAAASKEPATTMQAANDLSAAVLDLFALYNPAIPADIGRLDVLERQVILDAAADDFAAAAASLARTRSVWESVKPSVLAHNGKDVQAQFEASLATQEAAIKAEDVSALTSEANNGLELVDALEDLY